MSVGMEVVACDEKARLVGKNAWVGWVVLKASTNTSPNVVRVGLILKKFVVSTVRFASQFKIMQLYDMRGSCCVFY